MDRLCRNDPKAGEADHRGAYRVEARQLVAMMICWTRLRHGSRQLEFQCLPFEIKRRDGSYTATRSAPLGPGTCILIPPIRNPVFLAKEMRDHIPVKW